MNIKEMENKWWWDDWETLWSVIAVGSLMQGCFVALSDTEQRDEAARVLALTIQSSICAVANAVNRVRR